MCVMTCRRISKLSSLIALAWLVAAPVHAQPLIFERADIRVDPVAIVPIKPGDTEAAPRIPITYNVEVRAEDAMKLEYIHTLNTLTPTTGVVISFNVPSIAALPRMQVFTPVDALYVAEDGTIMQIYPDVVLAELAQDIYSKEPIKGFVFLKAGEVDARGILPKDIISGPMFYAAPPVIQ